MKNNKLLGKIELANVKYIDHYDIWTYNLGIKFNGFYQVFGDLSLSHHKALLFEKKICKLFCVKSSLDLPGKECYGLWSLVDSPIEGIETLNGKRFTISSFRKKYFPKLFSSPLDDKKNKIKNEIYLLQKNLKMAKTELLNIEKKWVDWETAS